MKHLLLTLLGICQFAFTFATDDIAFKHLGIKEGLSHSQINHITKDSQGFMWFSTLSGLNRYDGYNFNVFTRNSKDSLSLIDNYVDNVQEDAEGNLWIRTGRLVYTCYDPKKERFNSATSILSKRYNIKEEPTRLYIDKEKNIWCYVDSVGTHCYNIKTKQTTFCPTQKQSETQYIPISHITEDESGILYLYANGLIECIDRNSNKRIHRNEYLTHISDNEYSKYAMFVDADGDYWVYTKDNTGLWLYRAKLQKWEHLSTASHSTYVLSNNIINDVKQDAKRQIWIATDHGGINIIDKELHTIRYVKNEPFDERSLTQNSLNCLYCDESGIVWVGSYKRGVSYHSESIFKFSTDHLSDFSHIKNFIADANVIVEDKHANLWIGTNSSGVIHLDTKSGKRNIYQHHPHKNSLSNNVIVSMLVAKDGRIWMGTYQGGLNVFDGHTFTHYRHDPENPNSLPIDNIWALAEDSNGIIWIGTLGEGLQSFNPHTRTFTRHSHPCTEFAKDFILSICIGRDKRLYMSTASGITVYNPTTGEMEKWTGNKKGTQEFTHLNINQVYEDSRGLLWIATREGLNIYDRKKDEITVLNNETALGSNVIHAIVEDNNKNMWVTTTNGIINIIVSVDPKNGVYTYTYYRYNELDGLQDQLFNERSITKTSRGEIIAGGGQGLSFFDPENIRYNYSVPKVTFTDIHLFNKEIKIDSIYNGNRILTQSLNNTSKVELKYKQNMFSISFSAMNYILPEKTQYIYMLEGFNTNWLTADANKVTYTNLAPGSYTLKVKAINSDGFGSDEAAELRIVIRPPFWLSPIAYILYFLLTISILFWARRRVLRGERNRYKLAQIKQEAQQKHEIDDMKLRFFTNISHELRTPLTLILSPLENVIKTATDKEQKEKLEMMHRNAIRLLNMVNQLLDFRKSDVKGHQLNTVQGDIVEFIRAISNSFTEYSEKKHIHLTFFSAAKELFIEFDEDKMGKIIMNLLSNAFKFTPEGGRVDLYINVLATANIPQERLEISISDTGIGIKDEDKERIFERFYQVPHKDHQRVSGSGVGLHLAKEFIALHGGTISVRDNVGQGSVFIITLPITRVQTSHDEAHTSMPLATVQEDSIEITPEHTALTADASDSRPVILIVDDNDDFRLFMKDSLKADYQIKEAPDGAKAWELIPTLQPDIIVSDVMMPEMDGNELCRLVKNDIRTSHIPFILLTARSAKEQKVEGLESGADDYITKPFSFDILTLRIKKLLQLQHKRQKNFHGQMEVSPSEITVTSLDEKLIKKAIQYVEDHIGRSELSVEELSRELGMSRVHLYKKLLSITGKSPTEFIRIIRLKRAAQLLRQSQLSVSEIAYQVGFNSPKYFSKYFKEEFGILPSAYQEKGGTQQITP